MDERFRRGLETVRKIDAEGAERLEAALADIAPDLYRYIIGFAFGDVISRPGLDLRTREIATVSALTALGNAPAAAAGPPGRGAERRVHAGPEIVEVLMQMAVYAGIPAALNALYLAKEVFAERDARGLT